MESGRLARSDAASGATAGAVVRPHPHQIIMAAIAEVDAAPAEGGEAPIVGAQRGVGAAPRSGRRAAPTRPLGR